MPKDRNDPRVKFSSHKSNAKKVGTEFLLTFEEWWKIWSDSGHYHERGQHRGQYVMARIGDKGPYAVGNVKIVKHEENDSEGALHPRSDEHKRKVTEVLTKRNKTKKQRLAVSTSRKEYWEDEQHREQQSIRSHNRLITYWENNRAKALRQLAAARKALAKARAKKRTNG